MASLPGYDSAKCVKMALVHDLAESLVGDITPHDGVSKADKHAAEAAAMERLAGALAAGGPHFRGVADDMLALWGEYEACSTREALLVKDLDKVEMILQAHEYEGAQKVPLEEFFRSTRGAFLTPAGNALADDVRRRRAEAAAAGGDGGAAAAAAREAAIGEDLCELSAQYGKQTVEEGFGA